jgi:hypothetical protein
MGYFPTKFGDAKFHKQWAYALGAPNVAGHSIIQFESLGTADLTRGR